MKIPKYVVELMERSEYNYSGDPGYTVSIHKATPYTKAPTFKKELDRLISWANKQIPQDPENPTATINHFPTKTHYCDQTAIVTIYDPVMKYIEQFIRYERETK